MTEFDPTLIIFISTIIVMVSLVLIQFLRGTTTRRWNKHRAETVDKWAAEGVEFVRGPQGAQFGGLESMGINKVLRGVGLAVLTDKDFRMTRASPLASWCITFKQIKGVSFESAFMGKRSKGTPFIVLRFKKDGRTDKLGFQVKDFDDWAVDLAKAASVRVKDKRKADGDS